MGEKSVQKKQYIIDVSRKVFIEKGFRGVTMKDIVEACEISRGGLYLYYNNTAEIFRDVLEQEVADRDSAMEKSAKKNGSVMELLMVIFRVQRSRMVAKDGNLNMAIYEYFFGARNSQEPNILRSRFEEGAEVIKNLLELGVENGEFVCEYPELEARNMMYALEGLKIMAEAGNLDAGNIDHEIAYLISRITMEE